MAEVATPPSGGRRPFEGQPIRPQQPVYGATFEDDGVEMADVIESFGLRWCHVALLAVTWLLLLCPSSVIMATPYILGSLRHEYGISRAAAALVGSAVTLGAVIGTCSFGRLADLTGRRSSHLLAVVCIGLFFCTAFVIASRRRQPERWHGSILGLRSLARAPRGAGYFIRWTCFVRSTISHRVLAIPASRRHHHHLHSWLVRWHSLFDLDSICLRSTLESGSGSTSPRVHHSNHCPCFLPGEPSLAVHRWQKRRSAERHELCVWLADHISFNRISAMGHCSEEYASVKD